jgi:hypothetical protein
MDPDTLSGTAKACDCLSSSHGQAGGGTGLVFGKLTEAELAVNQGAASLERQNGEK